MGPKLKPTATVEGARIRLRLRQLKSNGFNQSSEKKSPGEVIEAGSALPKVSEKSSPALSNSRYGQTYSYVFATSVTELPMVGPPEVKFHSHAGYTSSIPTCRKKFVLHHTHMLHVHK